MRRENNGGCQFFGASDVSTRVNLFKGIKQSFIIQFNDNILGNNQQLAILAGEVDFTHYGSYYSNTEKEDSLVPSLVLPCIGPCFVDAGVTYSNEDLRPDKPQNVIVQQTPPLDL